MEPNELSCLLYVSTATRIFSDSDMQQLLQQSREKNRENEITGLLVYGNGHFLQVLEGSHENVAETFRRLCVDDRHQHVTKMLEEPVEARFFQDWSMAFRLYPSEAMPENRALQEILAGTASGTIQIVRELLRIFNTGLNGGEAMA